MATWSLREQPPPSRKLMLEIAGGILFIGLWWLVKIYWQLPKSVLPSPLEILTALRALFVWPEINWQSANTFSQNLSAVWDGLSHHIIGDAVSSIWLCTLSYIEAILISIPLGFLIGLFGPIRAMSERWVVAFRYLPTTAFVGVLVTWFGIKHPAMAQFLTLGLIVYLLPAVVVRVDEVEQVFVDTAKTCGATRWQRIRRIFWPLAAARISDDCKNLVPISWTYIILAEGFNLNVGGLGARIGTFTRASRYDFVFAVVILILIIGFVQDKLWTKVDRKALPWKYI